MSLAFDEPRPDVDNTRPALTVSDPDDRYLPMKGVRSRYGWCHMTVERRLRDDPDFPTPLYMRCRRYWSLKALIAWERKCAARPHQKIRRGVADPNRAEVVA